MPDDLASLIAITAGAFLSMWLIIGAAALAWRNFRRRGTNPRVFKKWRY